MCRRFNSCQHHIKPSDPEGFIIFPLLTLHLSSFTSHLSSLIPPPPLFILPILSHFGFPSHERIPGFVRHLSSVDFLANKYPGFARLMAFGYPRTNKCPRFVRISASDWPFANKKAFYVREVDPGAVQEPSDGLCVNENSDFVHRTALVSLLMNKTSFFVHRTA